MKHLILSVLIFICYTASAQCLLKEVSLQQRSNNSVLIIEGRVTAKRSFWNDSHTLIYTGNTVEIFKVFKGEPAAASVEIITEGGTVGLQRMQADPSLQLSEGEAGIFLCEAVKRASGLPKQSDGLPRYEAYASVQGFIRYDAQTQRATDPFATYANIENDLYKKLSPSGTFKTLKPFSLPASPQAQRTTAITGFSPSSVTAGTGTVLTINGSGFGTTRGTGAVAFKNADDGGASYINPLPTQYLSWNDNQITVQVPSGAGTGIIQVTQGASTFTSGSALTVSYAHLTVNYDPGTGTQAYGTRHINRNGTGGYVWQMNTGFDANSAAKASFIRAFNTWRCNTGINWSIGANTTVNSVGNDGTNVICFDNTSPLPAGILGTCYSFYSGCSSGGNIYWWVDELDIIFDEGSNISPRTWQYGTAAPSSSQYDFETVAVHELGHGHQLGHVISPGAIMHYAIANGTSNRSLSSNDLAGGNFVQAKSVSAFACASPMAAYGGCATLPLTVTSLKAYLKGDGIQVEWINETESEVEHYEVEKSVDGNVFLKAASVQPMRNNGGAASYNWVDARLVNSDNFYRIKSIGRNGKESYTAVARVTVGRSGATISVYPNPVKNGVLYLALNNVAEGVYNLRLYNAAGQQVLSKTLTHAGGSAIQTVQLPAVSPGLYCICLQQGDWLMQQTIVVGK